MDTTKNRPSTTLSDKAVKLLLLLALGSVVLLIAAMAYLWFSGGSGKPSGTTSAPVLIQQLGDTRTPFRITPSKSEVRFLIDEILLGNPNRVIGKTGQVAGDLLVDFQNPSHTQLGSIRVNVRTLETDNEIRNRVLRSQILQSEQDAYEFAEFDSISLVNIPEHLTSGQSALFQIAGKLTLHGITRDVTFDTAITLDNDKQLEGRASATVLYRDFNINIPEAVGVANVSDDVQLEIEFIAQAVSEAK